MTEDGLYLLVRNRVEDYATWRAVFDANAPEGERAGLTLEAIWQDADDANNVFFLMRVEDRGRAEAFMAAPESARAGEVSGVIDGEASFVRPAS